ncbi:MAG: hypothetical protein QNJ20_11300 [Paracoccaceae bacterium]|nr:hypothetical protein [Paracoccaceae bacterium]
MTQAQCTSYRAEVIRYLPFLEPLELSPSVSDDGWCRIAEVGGALADQIEWRARTGGDGFTADFRVANVRVAEEFVNLTATVFYDGMETLEASRVHLTGQGATSVVFSAEVKPIDLSSPSAAQNGFGTASLVDARLGVTGGSQFLSLNLAEAFGFDLEAAMDDPEIAEEQRREMYQWLDRSVIGPAKTLSWKGFHDLVARYPSETAGTVTISLRGGQSIPLQTLAVLWYDISQGREPDRKGLSSLEVTWSPR